MRKIDWDSALSEEDIAWLRQAGFMSEERIATHQAQFDAEIPEDGVTGDELTKSAMDPLARVADPTPGTGDGSPQLVDPTEDVVEDEEGDDYDSWKLAELENEVNARNEMSDTSEVYVEPTGANGKVLKGDLIKGLRLWDAENPGALKD